MTDCDLSKECPDNKLVEESRSRGLCGQGQTHNEHGELLLTPYKEFNITVTLRKFQIS